VSGEVEGLSTPLTYCTNDMPTANLFSNIAVVAGTCIKMNKVHLHRLSSDSSDIELDGAHSNLNENGTC